MSQGREPRNDLSAAAELAESYLRMRSEIAKVVIGQGDVVEQLLIGLFARGHVLLVGVPGLAKTLLVSTVARILSLSFRRIQFTPDMMPSDITGYRHSSGRSGNRAPQVHVHPGTAVRTHHPGR